jgi:hypothetical protein
VGALQRADGRSFSNRITIRADGDQIAVLDSADDAAGTGGGSVHLFAKQPNGSWLATGQFTVPGSANRVSGLAFGSGVVAVLRLGAPGLDGTHYSINVYEQLNGSWTQTIGPPLLANGAVIIRNGWMAVSRVRGVAMFRRLAPGQWQAAGVLAEEGVSSIGDNERGVGFDFDGQRVLMGTNDYSNNYFIVKADIHQLDSSGNWVRVARLETPSAFYPLYLIGPRGGSITGRDVSVEGIFFRDNGYGYWEQTGEVSQPWEYLSAGASALLGNGWALVSHTYGSSPDLFARGNDGFWRPQVRFSLNQETRFAALEDDFAVLANTVPNADPRLPGTASLSVVSLPATASRAFEPARIMNTSLFDATISQGGVNYVSAFVDVGGTPGATVRGVDVKVGHGAWLPLAARDGVFDAAFETVTGTVAFPDAFSGSLPVCFRVTDSAGRQTEMLDRGREPCPIGVAIPARPSFVQLGDETPPRVSEVMMFRSVVSPGQDNAVYAFADDSDSGELCTGQPNCNPTPISGVQFRIDNGVWQAMKPFAGPYPDAFVLGDSEWEATQGILPPASGFGTHQVCVRAMDTWGLVSQPQCTSYEVR